MKKLSQNLATLRNFVTEILVLASAKCQSH